MGVIYPWDNFPEVQFSSEPIVRGGGGGLSVGNNSGPFSEFQLSGGHSSRGQLSGGNFYRGQLSSGAIVRGGNHAGGNCLSGNYPGGSFPLG